MLHLTGFCLIPVLKMRSFSNLLFHLCCFVCFYRGKDFLNSTRSMNLIIICMARWVPQCLFVTLGRGKAFGSDELGVFLPGQVLCCLCYNGPPCHVCDLAKCRCKKTKSNYYYYCRCCCFNAECHHGHDLGLRAPAGSRFPDAVPEVVSTAPGDRASLFLPGARCSPGLREASGS